MGRKSWFLVVTLVILLSAAAVTHRIGGCWNKDFHNFNTSDLTHYNCSYQNFGVLSTENFDPRRTYINLTCLLLAKNRIRSVECDVFHHLRKLEALVLHGNLISVLDEKVFSSLSSLQLLDLSFNNLSILPHNLFLSQGRLETLMLQGNKLHTISVALLTPLISIRSLELSSNQLLCDCELRLTMFWCKKRMLDTKATCQSQLADYVSPWTELEFFSNCSKNLVPSVLSTSVTQYTKTDDLVVSTVSSSYVVLFIIVGAVAFQFVCFSLYLLYLRRQRPPSVSTSREEASVHSDSSSSHNYQYDYIQIPNIYTTSQLLARPKQTTEDLVHVQTDTCHNGHSGIQLEEPTLFGTYTAFDYREEVRPVTEHESKKLHRNNPQSVRSGVVSSVSYDLPDYEHPSKMAASNCNTVNSSSDASVMVENCLYSAVGTN